MSDFSRPIPDFTTTDGWQAIPITDTNSDEPLVPLGPNSDYSQIITASVYAGEHIHSPYTGGIAGNLLTMFVRNSVASKLAKAAELLPDGYYLVVVDAYRTIELQSSLHSQYQRELKIKHPNWTQQELDTETQPYVSLPSTDPTCPSPHNTGAAVDVVIVRVGDDARIKINQLDNDLLKQQLVIEQGNMLDFGTPFDFGGPAAALRYYENSDENITARDNRRMLYWAMRQAGFEPFESEWWHFNDPLSQMGAKVAGLDHAEFGASRLSPANLEHERRRREQFTIPARILSPGNVVARIMPN